MTTELFLAFDDLKKKTRETLDDIAKLCESGEPFGIKFNLDAMLNPKEELEYVVDELSCFDRPLFADLKMWNGSRTMESVVETFVDMEVDFINVWGFADKELAKAVEATKYSKTKILGLTILSHYDDAYCQKWFGRTLAQAVTDFSRYALEVGCHGIILPGTTFGMVKDLQTIKVATGVRPKWYSDDRHQQEATPAEVASGGADFAVCGSPVLNQPTIEDKIRALRGILSEIRSEPPFKAG